MTPASPGAAIAAATLLVVDDEPANLRLLTRVFETRGYRVVAAAGGAEALAAAAADPPDVVLLDINMPELGGFEVCARLKADPRTADAPVLFISGLAETLDKVRAFQAGGVDFVAKPFQADEVVARVTTHLRLRRLQRELRDRAADLDALVRLRTRELEDAHARLSILDDAKGDFLGLIAHELRTPLNGLFGVADLLFDRSPDDAETAELKDLFRSSRRRLLTLVEDALLLTQIDVEPGRFAPRVSALGPVLASASAAALEVAAALGVSIGPAPDDAPAVLGEPKLLARALQALLETAARFAARGETVRLSGGEGDAALVVEARGRAVPQDALAKFFDVLSIGGPLAPGGDLGLGPPVAERILALYGGSVSVENTEPAGIRLRVRLAAAPAAP